MLSWRKKKWKERAKRRSRFCAPFLSPFPLFLRAHVEKGPHSLLARQKSARERGADGSFSTAKTELGFFCPLFFVVDSLASSESNGIDLARLLFVPCSRSTDALRQRVAKSRMRMRAEREIASEEKRREASERERKRRSERGEREGGRQGRGAMMALSFRRPPALAFLFSLLNKRENFFFFYYYYYFLFLSLSPLFPSRLLDSNQSGQHRLRLQKCTTSKSEKKSPNSQLPLSSPTTNKKLSRRVCRRRRRREEGRRDRGRLRRRPDLGQGLCPHPRPAAQRPQVPDHHPGARQVVRLQKDNQSLQEGVLLQRHRRRRRRAGVHHPAAGRPARERVGVPRGQQDREEGGAEDPRVLKKKRGRKKGGKRREESAFAFFFPLGEKEERYNKG